MTIHLWFLVCSAPPPTPLPLAAQPLHFQKRSAAPDWLFNSLVLIQRKSALPSSYGSYFNRNRGNCNSLLQLPLAEVTIFAEIFFYLSFGIRRWNFSKIWPKNIISKYTKMTAVAHPHICPEEKQWVMWNITFMLKKRFFRCRKFHEPLNLLTLIQHVERLNAHVLYKF